LGPWVTGLGCGIDCPEGGKRVASRYQQGQLGAWLGIAGNVVLTLFKLAAGFIAGSQAMIADGVHSASDILGSTVVLVGLRVASAPADREHPYGHAKAEAIAAKIVALILLLAGLNIGYSSIRILIAGVGTPPGRLALIAAVISIVAKEGLYQYKIRLGRRIKSQAIIANAHEHRSDALSSTAALVGIVGARSGLPLLDPVAALVVSVFIVRTGWVLVRRAVDDLMDRFVDDRLAERIEDATMRVTGVAAVDNVRARPAGPEFLVDMEISVSPEISVARGHEIAEDVQRSVRRELSEVSQVFVHVEPHGQEDHRAHES